MQIALFGQNSHSWDGNGISPNSKFRALSVFINVIFDVNPNFYDSVPPSQYWGQASVEGVNNQAIPTYLLDFVDTVYDSGNLHGSMTRLYGESSFDSLQITGDFVVVNVKESRIINTYHNFNCTSIGNTAIDIINQNGLQTLYHHDSIYDYDVFHNNKVFFAQFMIRNITKDYGGKSQGEGTGSHCTSNKIRIGNNLYSIDKGSMQCVGSVNIAKNTSDVTFHEFSHSLFGTNDFHTSGGNHRGWGGFMPFFTLQGGYGLMGQASKSLMSCNGYERWRMHWKHSNAPDYITTRDSVNATYLISDIDKEDGNKTFLLRDFVTYGDVVRIKLPYKDSESASNQYIWLENHKVGYNNKWDFFQYSNEVDCRPQGKAGIYAYYQVGRHVLSGTYSDVWYSDERDNLKMITAEGYWDYSVYIDTNNKYNLQCVSWEDHSYYHKRESANPLCGYQDQECQIHPDSTAMTIAISQEYDMWRKKIGMNTIDSLVGIGDNRDAFSVYSKINMGTNPSTCNTKTYYNNMNKDGLANFTSQTNRNNQTTYLTGLSIEMIPQANHDFLVRIRWDDYCINNDARWTGSIALKEKAILTSNHTLLLTQNLTPAKPYRDSISGVFASTTVFRCEENSEFTLQPQSSVFLEQKSKIVLKSGSTFIISNFADVVVGAGCTFEIEPCATLIIQSSGALIIDDSAIFIVHPDAIIKINNIDNIQVPINSNFLTGNGISFSSTEQLLEELGIPSNFFINGNVVWNGEDKVLTQELVIGSGSSLTITNTVHCINDVIINVLSGGKLIVDGGTLTNACTGELWQGIFVEGTPDDSTQSENLQGVVELKNGAVIQNAVCGINVGLEKLGIVPQMYVVGGGIVKAIDASFINNKKAVEFGSYNRNLVVKNTHQRNNASYFDLCTFKVDNNALFNLNDFKQHVNLFGVRGIRFEGCTFESVYNTGSAIQSLSSGFVLSDYNWLLLNGIRSRISNFNTAIQIKDGGTKGVTINNTTFTNNNVSIIADGSHALNISSDTFHIPYNGYFGPTTGVSLTKCNQFDVNNNNFTGENDCNYGLIVIKSGANNNIVQNNYFSHLRTACIAYGKNSDGFNGTVGLQYYCNWFTNNNTDIYVDDYEGETGTIRYIQGDNNQACNNVFTNNGTSLYSMNFPFQYYCINSNYNNQIPSNTSSNIDTVNKLSDRCVQIGITNPNIHVERPGDWETNKLNEYSLINGMLTSVKNQYLTYNQTNLDWVTYYNGNPVIVDSLIYYGAEFSYDTTIYYDDRPPLDTVITYRLIDSIVYYYNYVVPEDLETKVNLYFQINDLESQLSEICHEAMYYIHSDSMIDFDIYHDWLLRTHTIEADYTLLESYYELGDYNQFSSTLNAIQGNPNFEQTEYSNYVSFYNLWDSLQANNIGWDSLAENSNLMTVLDQIANSGINGAAFKAQAIGTEYCSRAYEATVPFDHLLDLCMYIANSFGGEDNSTKDNLTITNQSNTEPNISLFPNPANDKLNVSCNNAKIQTIIIYDIVGKKVGDFVVNEVNTVLDVNNLCPSVYFISVKTESGVVTKRFVKE